MYISLLHSFFVRILVAEPKKQVPWKVQVSTVSLSKSSCGTGRGPFLEVVAPDDAEGPALRGRATRGGVAGVI